jgi:hypothetical protein
MFTIAGISIKLVLYVLLLAVVFRMRTAIDMGVKEDIQSNFKFLKFIVYTLLLVSYLIFIGKFFEVKQHRHTGITGVNLALISVLFVFMQLLDKAVANLKDGLPVAQETIDLRFTSVETLSYLLISFNYLSTGLQAVTSFTNKLIKF